MTASITQLAPAAAHESDEKKLKEVRNPEEVKNHKKRKKSNVLRSHASVEIQEGKDIIVKSYKDVINIFSL